jgi:hypothetical protein
MSSVFFELEPAFSATLFSFPDMLDLKKRKLFFFLSNDKKTGTQSVRFIFFFSSQGPARTLLAEKAEEPFLA